MSSIMSFCYELCCCSAGSELLVLGSVDMVRHA